MFWPTEITRRVTGGRLVGLAFEEEEEGEA